MKSKQEVERDEGPFYDGHSDDSAQNDSRENRKQREKNLVLL